MTTKPIRGRPSKGFARYAHLSARVNPELAKWVRQEARARKSTPSTVVRLALASAKARSEREGGVT